MFHGCFKVLEGSSRGVQGCFKGIKKEFCEFVQDVSWVVRGWFRVCHGCYKGVSGVLERVQ